MSDTPPNQLFPLNYPALLAALPKLLGVAALYALLAKIVLTYFSANGVVSIVWPPSGLALAVLLIGGKRYFPGVLLGALLANVMAGLALGTAAAIAVGNTLEALLGAWLLTCRGEFDPHLRTLRDYLRLLVLAGFVACSVAALNGSTVLLVSGFINAGSWVQNFLYWWMGDALGIIMVAPLILVWRRMPDGWLEPKRVAEAALVAVLTLLSGQMVFLGWFHDIVGPVAMGYWTFLLVAWSAIRLGIHGAVAALVVAAVQGLSGAVSGVGFFADDIARSGLVNYWFYMVTLSAVGMALATHFTERKLLERQLSRRLRHRDTMERITRISLSSLTVEELLERVLDEMLAVFKADRVWFLYPCDPDAPSWSVPVERTRPEWPGAFARGMVMPMSEEVAGVFREALASARPIPYGSAASRSVPAMVAEQFSVRSQLIMALRPRVGSPWLMGLHHCAQAHSHNEDDLQIFKDIGRRVADTLSSMIILKKLRESEDNLNRAQAVGRIGSWRLDIPSGRLEWSMETHRMFGIPQQEAVTLESFIAVLHPGDRDAVLKAWDDALAGAPYDIEHRIVVNGEMRWVRERARIERDSGGRPLAGIGTVQDITESKLAEDILSASENRYRLLVESSPFCIHEIDLEGRFQSMNRTGLDMLGLNEVEDICGKPYLDAVSRQDAGRIGALLHNAIADGTPSHFEFTAAGDVPMYFKSCFTPIKDANGKVLKIMGITEDITERKQAEEQIHTLAFYDSLTQLPNRRLLNDRLVQTMAASKRSGRYCALMFLDLDNFKPLNDVYGHDVGDLLLSEVARRITDCVREADTVARFGGDEFVVMLGELDKGKAESAAQAGIVAEKICTALAEPYLLKKQLAGSAETTIEHRCTSSIGVVLFINHEASPEDILKWADMAMYQAKAGGRNQARFFDPKL